MINSRRTTFRRYATHSGNFSAERCPLSIARRLFRTLMHARVCSYSIAEITNSTPSTVAKKPVIQAPKRTA